MIWSLGILVSDRNIVLCHIWEIWDYVTFEWKHSDTNTTQHHELEDLLAREQRTAAQPEGGSMNSFIVFLFSSFKAIICSLITRKLYWLLSLWPFGIFSTPIFFFFLKRTTSVLHHRLQDMKHPLLFHVIVETIEQQYNISKQKKAIQKIKTCGHSPGAMWIHLNCSFVSLFLCLVYGIFYFESTLPGPRSPSNDIFTFTYKLNVNSHRYSSLSCIQNVRKV